MSTKPPAQQTAVQPTFPTAHLATVGGAVESPFAQADPCPFHRADVWTHPGAQQKAHR